MVVDGYNGIKKCFLSHHKSLTKAPGFFSMGGARLTIALGCMEAVCKITKRPNSTYAQIGMPSTVAKGLPKIRTL